MRPVFGWAIKAMASCFFLTYPVVRWRERAGKKCTGAGLIGTLAGLWTAKVLPAAPWPCFLVLLGACFVGASVSDYAEELLGRKDDPRIVIDEWVGAWASVAWLPMTWLLMAAAFVLFRAFDVLKPLGLRRLGELPGGWGVVLDDLAAGFLVNGILRLALLIWPT